MDSIFKIMSDIERVEVDERDKERAEILELLERVSRLGDLHNCSITADVSDDADAMIKKLT